MRKLLLTLAVALIAAVAAAPAQIPTAFDAASIKPWAPPSSNGPNVMIRVGFKFDPGRMTATGVSLKQLIERAWDLKPYQVQGPDWLDSARFDVTAETQEPLTQAQMVALLQPYLEQQFQLKTHASSKVVSVYALVVADSGFKLKPPGPEGVAPPAPPAGAPARPQGRGRGPLTPGGIAMMMSPQGLALTGNLTMAGFADFLSNQVDRPVLDMTQETGSYEVHLNFAPTGQNGMMMRMGPGIAVTKGGAGPADQPSAPAPSIFSALPQQLGLKLDPRKAPIQLLVVDLASKTPLGN